MATIHRPRTRIAAATFATAASLALAGTAAAQGGDTVLSGSTDTGTAVKLAVGEFNNPTAFKIAGYEVECNNGTLSTKAAVYQRFDRSDPGSFKDSSKDKGRNGKLRFRSKTNISGTDDGAGTWTGSFKRVTKVFKKNGNKLDTCRVQTGWTAS